MHMVQRQCSFTHTFLITLLAILLSPYLSAQVIRLSSDPMQRILPDDVQLQAAARCGNITLVVWGSTVTGDAGEPVNALYMQLVRDTTPLEKPMVLTSGSAHPFGMLTVRNMGSRFLVCWNDRRSDSGVYYRIVDTIGTSSPERMLTATWMQGIGIVPIRADANAMLLWSDSAGTTSCVVDSLGMILEAPHRYSTWNIYGYLYPNGYPGYTVLDIGRAGPFVFGPNGREYRLATSSYAKFYIPYFLANDGTVATIINDMIREYRSVFDSVPYRTVIATVPEELVKRSELVFRDSSGALYITANDACTPNYIFNETEFNLYVHSIRETSPGIFGKAQPFYSLMFFFTARGCCQPKLVCDRMQLKRGIGNSYRATVYLTGRVNCTCQGSGEFPYQDTIEYSIVSKAKGPVMDTQPSTYQTQVITSDLPVRRLFSKSGSIVDLAINEYHIILTAPAARSGVNVPETAPAMMTIGGTVVVGWMSWGLDSTVALGRWRNGADIPVQPLPPLPMNAADNPSPSRQTYALECSNNTATLSALSPRADSAKHTWQQYTFWSPTIDGWKESISVVETNPALALQRISSARVPHGSHTMVTVGSKRADGGYPRIHRAIIDSTGTLINIIHSSPVPAGYTVFLPTSDDEYLTIDSHGINHFNRDSLVSYAGAGYPNYYPPVYIGLPGTEFLMAYFEKNRLRLARFSSLNDTLNSYQSNLIYPTSTAIVALENPLDSGIVVLYTDRSGVRLSAFDRFLNPLQEDVLVSGDHTSVAHPVASFNGDSIYIAWEDNQTGSPDIYGRVMYLRTKSPASAVEAPDGRAEESGIVSIAPNPASSSITVTLSPRHEEQATVELLDVCGRVRLRRSISAEDRTVVLNTSALPSGIYLARLRSQVAVRTWAVRIVK
ncbi:MAG: hypothetical protein JWQ98_2695 [Chlorobi bacterium]|nr:hypothetical protein [Chlorobiota bacterium]